jgi:hypothetical protein
VLGVVRIAEVPEVEEEYVFNGRHYRLAGTGGGWVISTGRPGETPVDRLFEDGVEARLAWSRMLACTIACHPRRLRSADINGTLLVLIADLDGRTHLGELAGAGGDRAVAFADHMAAVVAWRDRCCELAHAASAARVRSIHTT